jgi:hypothetical protein
LQDIKKLKRKVLDSVTIDPGGRGADALKQFHVDVLSSSDLIAASLAHELRSFDIEDHKTVATRVRETDSNVYLLETNLRSGPNLTPEQLRTVGRDAFLGVANLNLRIEEMRRKPAS